MRLAIYIAPNVIFGKIAVSRESPGGQRLPVRVNLHCVILLKIHIECRLSVSRYSGFQNPSSFVSNNLPKTRPTRIHRLMKSMTFETDEILHFGDMYQATRPFLEFHRTDESDEIDEI